MKFQKESAFIENEDDRYRKWEYINRKFDLMTSIIDTSSYFIDLLFLNFKFNSNSLC